MITRSNVAVPPPDWPRAASASGGPSAERGSREAGPGAVRDTNGPRPFEPLDDLDILFGATAGAALAALALVAAYHGVMWLAGQPPVFWGRVGAVAVLLVGCGAVAGGLLGLERAGQRRGR